VKGDPQNRFSKAYQELNTARLPKLLMVKQIYNEGT